MYLYLKGELLLDLFGIGTMFDVFQTVGVGATAKNTTKRFLNSDCVSRSPKVWHRHTLDSANGKSLILLHCNMLRKVTFSDTVIARTSAHGTLFYKMGGALHAACSG